MNMVSQISTSIINKIEKKLSYVYIIYLGVLQDVTSRPISKSVDFDRLFFKKNVPSTLASCINSLCI